MIRKDTQGKEKQKRTYEIDFKIKKIITHSNIELLCNSKFQVTEKGLIKG